MRRQLSFCLGQNAGYYPETVQREYNLGMEVGTHTAVMLFLQA